MRLVTDCCEPEKKPLGFAVGFVLIMEGTSVQSSRAKRSRKIGFDGLRFTISRHCVGPLRRHQFLFGQRCSSCHVLARFKKDIETLAETRGGHKPKIRELWSCKINIRHASPPQRNSKVQLLAEVDSRKLWYLFSVPNTKNEMQKIVVYGPVQSARPRLRYGHGGWGTVLFLEVAYWKPMEI